MHICWKCNNEAEQRIYDKKLACITCHFVVRNCKCDKIILSEMPPEPIHAKSRLANLIKPKKKRKPMGDKFWETIKYVFDWNEETKIMIVLLGAVMLSTVGVVQCSRNGRLTSFYDDQAKARETAQNMATKTLQMNKDSDAAMAKFRLKETCLGSGHSIAECKLFVEGQ